MLNTIYNLTDPLSLCRTMTCTVDITRQIYSIGNSKSTNLRKKIVKSTHFHDMVLHDE